ncbi:hypothetical protein A1D17_01455 [Pseudomonas fluorescens]|uniref:Uncharacterized protein n=1 Tax=Pseudomonas fluorescens TaxID=294 RepID=A0A166R0P0_PSEFL|nr:hypothetical protein A1D17_01455 [Pseudomonas fluorescens]
MSETFKHCVPEEVFAQCNGLAIHAPVKSPDTGRTGRILIEFGGYVLGINMKFMHVIFLKFLLKNQIQTFKTHQFDH